MPQLQLRSRLIDRKREEVKTMPQVKSYAPPYCQILICDPTSKVDVPEWEKGGQRVVVATDTCISCVCLPDMDGETEFTLGTGGEVAMQASPIFEGKLKTPGRKIVLETVEGNQVLEIPTAATETRVRIWTNRKLAPDKVRIAID
jgi:hypothetical protein